MLFSVWGLLYAVAMMTAQPPNVPELGSEAPDFVLEDSTGQSYRLSGFRGQKVVLEFFRSGSW